LYVLSAILIGFAAAVVAGMFGIGGAAITTPGIRVLLGTSPAYALGTPLPVTIPTALAGSITYLRHGLVEKRLAVLCGAGGLVGSVGGALLTGVLNLHYLMLATGTVVLYLAGMTIYRGISGRYLTPAPEGGEEEATGEERAGGPVTFNTTLALCIGLAAGLFSGLLGVGGGVVMIPSFLYLLRLPIKKAFGTSLAVITVIAIPGTVVHAFLGHVSWSLTLYLVIGAVPGGVIGARLSIKARERVLYVLFGSLLAIFGLIFIVNEIICMIG
jgi:uncharacterized membrane protein YfcA